MSLSQLLGNVIWTRISGHLWVLDPTDLGVGAILRLRVTHALDLHRVGFTCGFLLVPAGDPLGDRKKVTTHIM
jgi:hypothetical protein